MSNRDENLVAIHKRDIHSVSKAFAEFMALSETEFNKRSHNNPSLYKGLSPSRLEEVTRDLLKEVAPMTPFKPEDITLVSGHSFPDIMATNYCGVEVKSTKDDKWTSIGSSIVESTRNATVENIYMLFGKLGGNPPEFKLRPYQDCLSEIAVTHSPRYLINMELSQQETIFAKMRTTYESLRTSGNAIEQVRRYYRDKAIMEHKLEMPWWITSENIDSSQSFNIRLWNSLSDDEKKDLQAKCMILFPEALSPKQSQTKYNQTTLWLCSYNQVIVPNIRDFYSAGGKITHVNGEAINPQAAQVFARIVKFAEEIRSQLANPTNELNMLIEDYNPQLLKGGNLYENWLNICLKYAETAKVPLKKWIEDKPDFTFSGR